jgi:deoxyribonuclease V
VPTDGTVSRSAQTTDWVRETKGLIFIAMQQTLTHPWDLTPSEAEALQIELSQRVITQDRLGEVKTVAGVDVAYDKHSDKLVAAAVVLDAVSLAVLDSAAAEDIERFPYIPGLFSFRELPPIVLALQQLKISPDLIVCDGQGIAHPRRFGLASHLGVLFDVPTVGCGKTRLIGKAETPERQRGASALLVDHGEIVGSVLRTQDGIKPVFVSIGHKVSLSTACEWILKLAAKYRFPETTRQVDQRVRAVHANKIANIEGCHTQRVAG